MIGAFTNTITFRGHLDRLRQHGTSVFLPHVDVGGGTIGRDPCS